MRYHVEPVILSEGNERLRGLKHITPLHDAIIDKKPVTIVYKSFQWKEPQRFLFSPYILKEFRNRWFVFGRRHDSPEPILLNLALDRIEDIADAPKKERYIKNKSFHPQQYFNDIIGVTRMAEDKVEHIVFKVPAKEVPYVTTKPLHQSQKEINRLEDGSTLFSIDVILNFELERDILGYGENITIISPETLADKIHKRLKSALNKYENEEGD
jgi:predicted DNA-binding transcriptional regulator YafY